MLFRSLHFIHVKGKGDNPMPLLLHHGWPWTFWDVRKVIGPLTDPAAYGGDPADSFDVVLISLPGYGFLDFLAMHVESAHAHFLTGGPELHA